MKVLFIHVLVLVLVFPTINGQVSTEMCTTIKDCTSDYCKTGECTGGYCVYGISNRCIDNDPCTIDTCNPVTGVCSNTQMNCDDGLVCTTDYCLNGECVHNSIACPSPTNKCKVNVCTEPSGLCTLLDKNCNDLNPCTTDG